MSTAHTATPYSQKLGLVDSMLFASGWQQESEGWLAPESFRDLLAMEVGAGHVSRSVAIAAQVQADEAMHRAALTAAQGK